MKDVSKAQKGEKKNDEKEKEKERLIRGVPEFGKGSDE
jgi:hypothetical protein